MKSMLGLNTLLENPSDTLQRRQVYYVPGFKFAVLVKRNFGV
jgi:hypothetical protein